MLVDFSYQLGKTYTNVYYNELAGSRSVRAVRQRYRIVYQVEREEIVVVVVAVGLRKEGDRADIYRQAALLVKYTRQ